MKVTLEPQEDLRNVISIEGQLYIGDIRDVEIVNSYHCNFK